MDVKKRNTFHIVSTDNLPNGQARFFGRGYDEAGKEYFLEMICVNKEKNKWIKNVIKEEEFFYNMEKKPMKKEDGVWVTLAVKIPEKVSKYDPETKKSVLVDNAITTEYHEKGEFTTVNTKVRTVDAFKISDKKLDEFRAQGKSDEFIEQLSKNNEKPVYMDLESAYMRNIEMGTNGYIKPGDTILVNAEMKANYSEKTKSVYFTLATASSKKDDNGKIIANANVHASFKKMKNPVFFYKDLENMDNFENKKKGVENGYYNDITVVISKMDKQTALSFSKGSFKNAESNFFKLRDGVYTLSSQSLERPMVNQVGDKTYYNPVTIPIIAGGVENTPAITKIDNYNGTVAFTGDVVIQSYTDAKGEVKERLALDISKGLKDGSAYNFCSNAYQIALKKAEVMEKALPQPEKNQEKEKTAEKEPEKKSVKKEVVKEPVKDDVEMPSL